MARLTKKERAAIRSALAAFIADEHDDETFDEFDLEDAESALGKVQEPKRTSPERTSLTRASPFDGVQ